MTLVSKVTVVMTTMITKIRITEKKKAKTTLIITITQPL